MHAPGTKHVYRSLVLLFNFRVTNPGNWCEIATARLVCVGLYVAVGPCGHPLRLTNVSLPISIPYHHSCCSSGRGRVRAPAGSVYEHYEAKHRRLRDAADQDLWQ